MNLKRSYVIIAGLVGIFTNPVANADLDDRMEELCWKMKSCSKEQMDNEDIPPEMVQMMETMFDGMCTTWMAPYAKSVGQVGLQDKAEACVESILEQDCETLIEAEGEYHSSACKAFEDAAEQAASKM